jgi:DNA-binding response OmpR family regulator
LPASTLQDPGDARKGHPIVDGELGFRELLAGALRDAGYAVDLAETTVEATNLLRARASIGWFWSIGDFLMAMVPRLPGWPPCQARAYSS